MYLVDSTRKLNIYFLARLAQANCSLVWRITFVEPNPDTHYDTASALIQKRSKGLVDAGAGTGAGGAGPPVAPHLSPPTVANGSVVGAVAGGGWE